MAKVLLVDTNFSSQPIYSELQRLGHEVHVVGGNPVDCLAKIAEHYWQLDYADTNALRRLIENENFDFIVPGCTDRSYASCSTVGGGRFYGIESVEIEQKLNNKAAFRSLAESLDLTVPKLQDYQSGQLRWPMIVKPTDSFSGKGITVLRTPDQSALAKAIELAKISSATHSFLIEDYVEGQLYSHSAFLRSGQICRDFIVQENCTVNPFVVDTSRVVFDPPDRIRSAIRQAIERLAARLALKDGLIHTQFIDDGEVIWLIEITRRCPGDLYSQLIELSTGFAYSGAYADAFTRGWMQPELNAEGRRFIIRHTVTVPNTQTFLYLQFQRPVMIERWVAISKVGDRLNPSPASRVGVLFVLAGSEVEGEELYLDTCGRRLYSLPC